MLDFHSDIQRLLQSLALLEPLRHLIDDITGVADFVIGGDLHFFVKATISDIPQGLNNFRKRNG